MSLAGFKKQLNKANQYVSEKIGGAKGTELDDEFLEMEKKIDVMGRLVDELMARTHELLQPNPGSRAKLSAVKSISKLRGQANQLLYPQPEGLLGDCMINHGKDLGDDSLFGRALVNSGETYKQLADIKYSLEDNVKQNFIEPLNHIQTKDLREVNHHRKKMSGRRLDYDCKIRKQKKAAQSGTDLPISNQPQGADPASYMFPRRSSNSAVHNGWKRRSIVDNIASANMTEEEMAMAEEKFEESKQLAETAMWNLLENDVEQISALASFIDAEVNFHRQSADALQQLHDDLQEKISEAASRPKRDHIPKRVASSTNLDKSPGHDQNSYNSYGGSQNLNTPTSYGSYGNSREDISQVGRDEYSPQQSGTSMGSYNADPYAPTNSYGEGPPSYTTTTNSTTKDPFDPFGLGELNSFSSPQQQSFNKQPRDSVGSFGVVEEDSTYATVDYAQKANRRSISSVSSRGGMNNGNQGPHAKALYDFDPENEGELGFKEGDIIVLTERIDENWFEGRNNGVTGFFPVNYVDVVVDL